jgi:hypothetical protein
MEKRDVYGETSWFPIVSILQSCLEQLLECQCYCDEVLVIVLLQENWLNTVSTL